MKCAYGGIVFDGDGNVLLRKPANEFDGYVWTFPKGGAEPGESPDETALREVLEETGVLCDIVGRVSGEFAGGTSVTSYFVMRVVSITDFDETETAEVIWASPEEAKRLIQKTRNEQGRKRDLMVLRKALAIQKESDE